MAESRFSRLANLGTGWAIGQGAAKLVPKKVNSHYPSGSGRLGRPEIHKGITVLMSCIVTII